MTISKLSLLALVGAGLMASGCTRLNNDYGNGGLAGSYSAVPATPVVQTQLPPVTSYPDAPGMNNQVDPNMQNVDTSNASANAPLAIPANAASLTPASVAGVWRANVGASSCQIATPQTKYGQGYRAGPLHCPLALNNVRSWAVNGNVLNFYDDSGAVAATLYSQGNGFTGRSASGQTITLSR